MKHLDTTQLCKAFFYLLLSVSLAPLGAAYAQTATGDILGTVMDETMAIVPGVTVIARNVNTNLERQTITGDAGGYLFALLPAGDYSISAELPGFKRETVTSIVLRTGQRARVNLTLTVGEVTEEVIVEGSSPLIKTDSMDLSTVVHEIQLHELPLNARLAIQLVSLDASITRHNRTRTSYLARFGGAFSSQGSPAGANNYYLDGIDMRGTNDTRAMRVSMDAIQEFKNETAMYSAEKGRGSGAQVTMVTKSGTNEFHGTAFWFHRNDALDARNFFDPPREERVAQGLPELPEFKQNQFGVSIGGPIVRDRTFFFFSYEGWRIGKSATGRFTVPPLELRNGDFSGLSTVIYDPATTREDPNNPGQFIRDPFPGNVIPADRIDPVSANALEALFPLPSVPGLVAANLLDSPTDTRDENLYTVRIDHQLSDKDAIFGRYSAVFDTTISHVFSQLPNFSDFFNVPMQNADLSYTRSFSPQIINEFMLGYNRMTQHILDVEAPRDVPGELGITGTNPLHPYNPRIAIAGFNRTGPISNAPNGRSENIYMFVDNFSFQKGKHALGVGVDWRHIRINGGAQSNPNGSFSFRNQYTRFPGDPGSGHAMADFLLGWVRVSATSEDDGFRNWRTNHVGVYFKDNWNATTNLTVNLGLRYEFFSPHTEIRDHLANFLPEVGEIVSAGDHAQFNLPRSLVRSDKNNVAPRIGFAYRPFGNNRTVVRASYGIYYAPPSTLNGELLGRNPPFLRPLQFVGDDLFPNLSLAFAFPVSERSVAFTPWAQPPEYRIGYNQMYSLNIQRELMRDLMLEIAYVGNKGTKLPANRNINQPRPGPGDFAPRRPFPDFQTINMMDFFGSSIYHGFKVNIDKRFSQGLQFLLSYTWSKLLDTGGLFSFGESNDGLRRDALDPASERGRSIFDTPHRFVFSYYYELPFAIGGAGWLKGLTQGWQLSGVTTFQSGTPVDIFSSVDFSNTGGGSRPNLVGNPNTGPETTDKWFNTEAFEAPSQFTFGDTGRNIVQGPGLANFDIALVKSTNLKENQRLEFRAEFFNAFNHTNFEVPNGAFLTGNFGKIFSTADARQIQFGLKLFF